MKKLEFTKKLMLVSALLSLHVGATQAQLELSINPKDKEKLGFFALPDQSTANVVYLSEFGDDENEGLTLESAVSSLQRAVNLIQAATTNPSVGTIYVEGSILVSRDPTLVQTPPYPIGADGTGAWQGTSILSGVDNGRLTVEGLPGTGAKIYGDKSARLFQTRSHNFLHLKNITLSGSGENNEGDGFGVWLNGGFLAAENVIFENFAGDPGNTNHGGAIKMESGLSSYFPYLYFKDCTFRGNKATGGAGIRFFVMIENTQVWVENCVFIDNWSYSTAANQNRGGAALYFRRGGNPAAVDLTPEFKKPVVTIINSTFTNNNQSMVNGNAAAYDAGVIGVEADNIIVNIVNSTVKDNLGNCRGVSTANPSTAPYIEGTVINIYNSIIERNPTTGTARGVGVGRGAVANLYNSYADVQNTYGQSSVNGVINRLGGSPNSYTPTSLNLLNAIDPATNTFTPRAGSNAINFGEAEYLEALGFNTDQLGVTRNFVNGKVDAGSIELAVTEWTGAVDSDWSDNANWTKGAASKGYTATIPAGTPADPVLTADAAAKSLTIEKDATLDLAGFTLDVDELQITTVLDEALTGEYASIGIPFEPSALKEGATELAAGTDFNLQALVQGYDRSDFETATAIEANTGYLWNWLDDFSAAELTITSGPAVIGGALAFGDTYQLQANPNLAASVITLDEGEHLYKLNAAGDKYEEQTGEIVLAPFEAVITVKVEFPKTAVSEIIVVE